jgi:hypothetical protein
MYPMTRVAITRTLRPLIALLAAIVVVLAGTVAPVQAVADRTITGQVNLNGIAVAPGAGEVQIEYTMQGDVHDPADFVVNDASGNFSITGLEHVPYYLYARYIGPSTYVSQWFGSYPNAQTMSAATPINGDSTSISLYQTQTVGGTVSLGSASTLANANVEVSYRRFQSYGSYSDWSAPVTVTSSGSYSLPNLPPGEYQFRYPYVGPDHAFQNDKVVTVFLHGNSSTLPPSNLTLLATSPLTGLVTLGAGGSPAGAGDVLISFERYLGAPNYAPEPSLSGVTDATGHFSVQVNPGTSYRLTFTYVGSGGFQAVTTPQPLYYAPNAINVTIPAVHALSGHIDLYDAFDGAAPAAPGDVVVGLVDAMAQSPQIGPFLYGPVTVDSSGDWAIDGVPAGRYYVRVDYTGGEAGYRPSEFISDFTSISNSVVVSGDISDLDHVYGGWDSLAGVVTDAAGNPLAGVSVLATAYLTRDDQEWFSQTVVSDASGRYQFENLSGGSGLYYVVDYDLSGYSAAQYGGWGYYYDPEFVDIPADGHVMLDTVELTHPGSISGTITSPNISPADFAAGLVKVQVLVLDGSSAQWVPVDQYVVQANGTYSIPDLYVDIYKLKITYKDFVSSTLSPILFVDDGEDVTYNGSITATPQTIGDLYAELGGASGPLGASTGSIGTYPNDGGGKLQHFANGTIYASNIHGTFVVWAGPIRDQYFAANSIFGDYGWPVEPQFCERDPSDEYDYCYQYFANGDYLDATSLGVTQNPVVIGHAVVGGTVSVAPANYYPVSPTSYSYAWFRDGVQIAGATGATYTPVTADLGHVLDVQVTGLRAGFLPTVSMSYPGPTVGPSAASQIAAKYAAAGGSAGPLGAATSAVAPFSFSGGGSVQHFTNGSIYVSAAGAFIVMAGPIRDQYWGAGSVYGSYGWPQADVVCDSSTCSQYFLGGTISAPKTVVSTPPVITGIAIVGGTLTVGNGTYTPAATSYTYRWFRNGVVIAGAAAKTYVPVAGDVGQVITAEVTAKSASSMPVAALSAPTGSVVPTAAMQIATLRASTPWLGAAVSAVVPFSNGGGGSLQHFANGSIYSSNVGGTWVVPAGPIRDAYWAANSIFGAYQWPTSAQVCASGTCTQQFVGGPLSASPLTVNTPPTVGGTPRVGGVLTAAPGLYTPSAQTFVYAWLRDGVRIAGATASTYVPTAADETHTFQVEVTAGRTGSVSVTTLSAATAAVGPSAAMQIASLRAATPSLGAAVSAVVPFADGGGGSLQHFANGSIYSSNVGGTWVVFAGPIRDAYWAANSIFGVYKWPAGPQDCSLGPCRQVFTNGSFIQADPLVPNTVPTIGGGTRVGGTLIANPGAYTPSATSFAYAWFRDGARVAGAASSYVLTAADEGHVLEVEATASRTGFVSVTTRSAPTAAILPSAASLIASLAAFNSAQLGSATSGVVSFPDNGGGAIQHYQNGSIYASNITGTFIVWAGPIRDTYWAANSIFGVYKWPTGPQDCSTGPCKQPFLNGSEIIATPLAVTTPPTVGGVTRVGGTLVATPGTYSQAAQTITYSWFRDTFRVPGSSATYVLTAADEGHTIKVEVTARRTGFVSVTTLSAPTVVIGPSAASAIAALRAGHTELGNPTSSVVAFPDNGGGSIQHFQNGSIYSSNVTGTFIVQLGIRTSYWGANSIFGMYKWPTAAAVCTSGPSSCTQHFQGGDITATTG